MNSIFDSIADGLAENAYAVVDQFLSQSEVDAILNSQKFDLKAAAFKKAGIGKHHGLQINEAIRGDYIRWLDKNDSPAPVKIYLDRLDDLIQYLNKALYLSLKDFEVHITVYPPGTYYKRHLDQFKHDDHRKLSIICYLNNQWKPEHGGELRMHLKDEAVDFLPLSGRLICFRSDTIEHEVLPATRERLSLTGWMLDQERDLKLL